MGHVNSLLARLPISGCTFSLPLEQRRWQKRYCFCPGDSNVRYHHPRSTNTCAWGLHSPCNHQGQHDGCRSSCYLSESKSKNKNKSAKEILNKIDSFFRKNCQRPTKRTGHYAWPCHSFSWSDRTCDHPSFCRTCCSLSPCHRIKDDRGVDCLDDNNQIGNRRDCVGCFDGN